MVKCIAVRCDSGYKKKLSSVRDGSVKKTIIFTYQKVKRKFKDGRKLFYERISKSEQVTLFVKNILLVMTSSTKS